MTTATGKRGRPRKDIDGEMVSKLAQLGCSHEEIAGVVGCERSTLERNFAADISKGRSAMKTRLRRLLLRAAERGSAAILIFLAKSILGMQEQVSPQVEVQFVVHQPDGAIPCACDEGKGAAAGCSLCRGSGFLPPAAEA